LPGAWDEQCKFLQVARQIWRHALSAECCAIACRVIDASLIAEMKDMADQNRRLKKMYAEMSMQNGLLKEALGKNHIDCIKPTPTCRHP
jgi:hypothetical protein